MAKKKRGHFCRACGRSRPNEKFSGKGHRQHICKDCKREGKKAIQPSTISTSIYDKKVNHYNKAIKNCLILYTQRSNFFLFEYQRKRYITREDFDSEIFLYQQKGFQTFYYMDDFQLNEALVEVLFKKYYETIDNGHTLEYSEIIENEFLDMSKKRQQYLEVIISIKNLM